MISRAITEVVYIHCCQQLKDTLAVCVCEVFLTEWIVQVDLLGFCKVVALKCLEMIDG